MCRELTPVTGITDPGEEAHDCAVREVLEETGWTIRVQRRLGAFQRYTRQNCPVYDGGPYGTLRGPGCVGPGTGTGPTMSGPLSIYPSDGMRRNKPVGNVTTDADNKTLGTVLRRTPSAADTIMLGPLVQTLEVRNAGPSTATGVQLTDRGAIAIDEYCRTNVENVYAIGDCTAKLMLAHVAEAQGVVAAETIAGAETMPIDYDFIPRATYCHPQIGSFGYSEEQAKEKGFDVKTATFPFTANGKAMGLGDAVGFVKVVADAEHNEIIGAHMIGPDVTELLPVLTLAQKWDLTALEAARNVHTHPTLSEAVQEAFHGIAGHMINL